jgi:hypothetical protein
LKLLTLVLYVSTEELFVAPQECGMAINDCFTLIGVWSVGETGQCLNPNFGFRFGASSYKYAILQVYNMLSESINNVTGFHESIRFDVLSSTRKSSRNV